MNETGFESCMLWGRLLNATQDEHRSGRMTNMFSVGLILEASSLPFPYTHRCFFIPGLQSFLMSLCECAQRRVFFSHCTAISIPNAIYLAGFVSISLWHVCTVITKGSRCKTDVPSFMTHVG